MVKDLNFQGGGDRTAPQNIEAEESILGGILLDPEAINRVAELLNAEMFSISAHQQIYKAALALHSQGKPTDLMSVTTWLADRGQLVGIGGQSKLAQLIDRTVSAVNIDQYAQLVADKAVRRKLIHAGNEVIQLGYETATELPIILDRAEQTIFNITQARPQKGLTPISETLSHTYQELENRDQGLALPGLHCNFYDLDAMTGGFQRSDLIVVAGRPAMGKCLCLNSEIILSDGNVLTIEEIYKLRQAEVLTLNKNWKFTFTKPSVFVDDGMKPIFRVTTRLGRFVETTITHPYLTINGWKRLGELKAGDKIAVPRKIEVFGTETIRDCEAKLLGYLIGDGGLTTGMPNFTNGNSDMLEDFTDAALKFGGVRVRVEILDRNAQRIYVIAQPNFVKTQRKRFGDRLHLELYKRNWYICQAAEYLGVKADLVWSWIFGDSLPDRENFSQLCDLLGIQPENLAPGGLDLLAQTRKNRLTGWLDALGLWGKDSHNKTVPAIVFKLKRSQIALFLNRLFATDGWASVLASGQAQLGYATVSEKLARQVQHLLLRFGIIAALKKRSVKYKNTRRTAWQLDITDSESIKTFISEIGIFGKEDALSKVEQILAQKGYHTNRDLIPVEVWEQIAAAKGNEPWTVLAKRAGLKGYSNIHVGKRALSRERLLQLAMALDNLPLQQLATSDVYWDEIVSIEPMGVKQVYDLTIPETHNFVANDICVHNTSFAMAIAHKIAEIHKLPVAIFSLEMSKEQLVQRLLAGEAGIESNRLRAGRISQNEWDYLSRAIGTLSELPLFIDDTPNITVTEMRSQARRLQAENGGALGLILIDYLQLMEGGAPDNRVQELSRITRSLKGLARELSVPVIALSQLSRSVESRTNKRPMMSDLRESGCLAGESLVTLADSGVSVPISELVGKSNFTVWALNEATMKLEKAVVSNAFATGVKPVFQLKTRLGRTIRATGNHKFRTIHGWKRLDELEAGDRLAIPPYLPSPSLQSMSYHTRRESTVRLAQVVKSDNIACLANSDIYWDEIVSIEADGETDVYDLTVPGFQNFIANNIVAHNSIEQDSDIVIMLYRDEYYSPDTPDRGIAEIIITKHRNGPTGTIKLLFDPQYTRFRNLATPNRP